MLRFSSPIWQRNVSISCSMRRFSASLSTYSLPETQSPSSSNEQIASGFRFSAERYSYFFRARFLVILLANTENGDGLSLGMAFYKPKYLSFTHSSRNASKSSTRTRNWMFNKESPFAPSMSAAWCLTWATSRERWKKSYPRMNKKGVLPVLPKALFLSTIEKIRQQEARIDEFDKALSKMCDGFPAFCSVS